MGYVIGDIHIDKALSNISVAYMQNGLIGDLVCPGVAVEKESDRYYIFGTENMRLDDDLRADGDEAKETSFTLSNDVYTVDEHALKDKITDRRRKNADKGLNLERALVDFLTAKIVLRREKIVADLMFNAANFSNAVPAVLWDAAGSTPIVDITARFTGVRQSIGRNPNTLILGDEVWKILKNHSVVQDRVKYTSLGVATPKLLAELLDIENVFIGAAAYNSAAEGLAANMVNLWGKHALLCYVPPTPGLMTPATSYRFNTRDREVVRWREPARRADLFEVSDIYDVKLVGGGAGFLLRNVIA